MTKEKRAEAIAFKRRTTKDLFLATWLLFCFCGAVFFSPELKRGVIEGMKLAAFSVIPAIFPFFVFSDLLTASFPENALSPLEKPANRLFGIGRRGIFILFLGALSGFPLGAHLTADAYRSGEIPKEEAERLLSLSALPSPAFLIGGVGGMFGDPKHGLLLWLLSLLSAMVTGVFFHKREYHLKEIKEISRQNFHFAASVKHAGERAVGIAAFLLFFSAVVSLLRSLLPSSLFLAILPFLEIGNAASSLTPLVGKIPLAFPLLAFSCGFGGVCVLSQIGGAVAGTGLSLLPCFLKKLAAGVLAFLLALLLSSLAPALFPL